MARYERINLDGITESLSLPAAGQLQPGVFVNAVNDEFAVAANGDAALFIATTLQTSTNVDDPIAAGDNVNAEYCNANRRFAAMLAAAQTVAFQAELEVGAGGMLTVAAAGAGQFYAQEALTTGAGETALIHVRTK